MGKHNKSDYLYYVESESILYKVFSLLNFVDSEVPIENITRKTFKHVIDNLMDRYIEK